MRELKEIKAKRVNSESGDVTLSLQDWEAIWYRIGELQGIVKFYEKGFGDTYKYKTISPTIIDNAPKKIINPNLPATEGQIWKLKDLGINDIPEAITKGQAHAIISDALKQIEWGAQNPEKATEELKKKNPELFEKKDINPDELPDY